MAAERRMTHPPKRTQPSTRAFALLPYGASLWHPGLRASEAQVQALPGLLGGSLTLERGLPCGAAKEVKGGTRT